MGKNITVETDGTSVSYNGVEKISTHDVQGNSTDWIPMEDTKLAKKTVKKNKTYKAENDGYYGYSQVKVKVGGKVTGLKADDSKPYAVDVDDEGNLVYTELPVSISIITNPTKTAYSSGEPIDVTGAVVKAYLTGGTELGVCPVDELYTTPEIANISNGASQTVTMNWDRDEDSETLQATFSITVST